jgi:hypothetical protein
VLWKGYPEEDATWEPLSSFASRKIIATFEKRLAALQHILKNEITRREEADDVARRPTSYLDRKELVRMQPQMLSDHVQVRAKQEI